MTGILCLDKPHDMTSFGAVSRVRRIAGIKKAGHAGTLDPMATGVLPVMLGGATRFLELLPNHDKRYRAVIKLGISTDTLDITGKIVSEKEVNVKRADFENCLWNFRGDIMQVPPMYSAVQRGGVRLYDLARKGIEVEREPRRVSIYKLELLGADELKNEYEIDIFCSKGTYIRSLAADIGNLLGCGGTLLSLRRTAAAGFTLEDCVSLEQLKEYCDSGNLAGHVISVEQALSSYPEVTVSEAQTSRFRNGGGLFLDRVGLSNEEGFFRVFSPERFFLGIGEVSAEKGELTVKRLYIDS